MNGPHKSEEEMPNSRRMSRLFYELTHMQANFSKKFQPTSRLAAFRPDKNPAIESAVTSYWSRLEKVVAGWSLALSRRNRSGEWSRSKSLSWEWTPGMSSPGLRPNGKRWL